MTDPFAQALAGAAERVRAHLRQELSALPNVTVVEAMGYAVAGGKGLRGFLVLEGARLHGIAPDQAVWSAAAIEAVHSYSLVHDDLPAMDDDNLRRGQPTVHIKYDEATAILAGDALLTLAFEFLARDEAAPDPARRIALVGGLAQAAGAKGMVLGQALDMAAETATTPLTLDEITALQAGKTGALIEWAAMAGPRLAGAETAALGAYARALGLAFQIADDVLDVTGDAQVTGKRVGKDAQAGKATFVSLLGLEGARDRARRLVDEAQAALAPYGSDADILRAAARFVIEREA